jgi:hypothetical protein
MLTREELEDLESIKLSIRNGRAVSDYAYDRLQQLEAKKALPPSNHRSRDE